MQTPRVTVDRGLVSQAIDADGVPRRRAVARCRVLEEDPDLAEGIPPASRARALDVCLARSISIPQGPWTGLNIVSGEGIGLLVLSGRLLRRVGIDARYGAELLGEGDLLRPWQGEDEPPTLPMTTGWRVLEPTRMAVLDEAVAKRFAAYPQLYGRLVGRALQRSRNLAVNMAIVQHPRVDTRLHMLFWHLAQRWGRVGPEGITLALALTHSVLADLTAARRPTVTSALSELVRQDLIRVLAEGWLLLGDPPGELLEITSMTANLAPPSERR